MEDGISTVVVYVVKLLRFCVLWIALFVVEKVYQDAYVSAVLVNDGRPPDLRLVIVYALLVDFVFSAFVFVIVYLLHSQYPQPSPWGGVYALDSDLAAVLLADYLVSVVVMAGLGAGVASVVQDSHLLRYRDDGLRSIRALGTLLLYGALVVLLVPYYRLVL